MNDNYTPELKVGRIEIIGQKKHQAVNRIDFYHTFIII